MQMGTASAFCTDCPHTFSLEAQPDSKFLFFADHESGFSGMRTTVTTEVQAAEQAGTADCLWTLCPSPFLFCLQDCFYQSRDTILAVPLGSNVL